MSLFEAIRERPRRFEDGDVTDNLRIVVEAWLYDTDPDDLPEFLRPWRQRVASGVNLPVDVARMALNVLRSRLGAPSGNAVPDGTYTVVFEGGDRRTLRLRTQPENRRFAPGRQIVSYLCGPTNTTDYRSFAFSDGGDLQVWQRYRGSEEESLLVEAYRVLCGDPCAAAKAYGLESGRCGVCGKMLTVPESIEAGIGPVCASERGWL